MQDRYDKLTNGLLLGISVVVFLVLAYAAYDENFGTDWYRHQSEYKGRLLGLARTERQREAAERYDVGQKQLFLPDLDRIDRCITCHVAIDNPSMADAPQPLMAHPGDIMQNHPKEQFGCTICHAGQGRATIAADAHGHIDHWPDPMVATEELDRSCPKCHTERSLPNAPRYNMAMDLFYEYGCLSCHKLRGRGGDIGPDITNAGELHDAEWHFKHFKDPRSVVPTSEMPKEDCSDEQAQLLTFLMMCYKGGPIPTALLSNKTLQATQMKLPEPLDPLALEGFVGSQYCIACHAATHPETVETWRESKMTSTYDRIRHEPIRDNCLPCHATGLNSATGHFAEEGVGCEGCHGPGREAVRLVLAGKPNEHKELLRMDDNSEAVCARCHNPHVPLQSHAEFYRKLPSAGWQPTTDEAIIGPEPGDAMELEPVPRVESEQITAEGRIQPVESTAVSLRETPPVSAPIAAEAGPVGRVELESIPSAASQQSVEGESRAVLEDRKVARPDTFMVEVISIPELDIVSRGSSSRRPVSIDGGCVSGDCHSQKVMRQFVHGPTAQQDCESCHRLVDEQNHRFDLLAQEPDLCYECHDPPPQSRFQHGPVTLGVCTVCHDPHSADNQFMLSETGNELCFACHTEMREHVNGVRVEHDPVREKECTVCHDSHASDFERQLRKDVLDLCLECHEPVSETIADAIVAHDPVATDSKCANCHQPHGSDVPQILVDQEADLCLDCHNRPMETPSGPITNMKALIEDNPERHGPIREGNCTPCHQSHGSRHFRILSNKFPRKFYSAFSVGAYDLCFQCHEETLVLDERTTALTDFRNGDKNLHYVHVNQMKGRTCRACHEVHAGKKPKRMRDSVPFGNWMCPVDFELQSHGGTCAPGCHLPRAYDRRQEIAQP